MELHAICLFICSFFNDCISDLDRVASSDVEDTSFRHLNFGVVKGKAIPLQAWAGPEGSRRFRLPDFKTIGT